MSKRIAKADRIEWWPRANVRMNPNNARKHGEDQLNELAAMMREVWTMPCLVVEDADNPLHGEIVAGHGRFLAAERAGYDDVRVMVAEGWTKAQIDRYALFDNQIALLAEWDDAILKAEIARIRDEHGAGVVHQLGWTQDALDQLLNPQPPARQGVAGSLADAFGVPPFSVLNAREGWWQNRKKLWINLGIQSEIGRGDLVADGASHRTNPGGGGRMYAGRTADGSFKAQRPEYSRGSKK